MNETGTRDFLVGLFVLAGLGALAFLSFSIGGLRYTGEGGLPVYATFDQIAGLKPKAPVDIAGVKVGQVTGISLDESYRARVDMDLDRNLKLPVDSSAAIVTSGLLGDRYIQLSPGAEDRHLAPGEQIPYTESALVMERLIGKFLVNVGDSPKEDSQSGSGSQETAPAP
ncbi:MAG TPA: outer membrane lipid asymmetry maintenance protein MlaD [Candidatus Binatia bacterium]|nr:outer membrane lipid asymmetry maintenance protein MlaD [Candidatus Binatia bacterium]